MHFLKQDAKSIELVEQIENEAEQHFRSRKINCAESALKALKDHLRPDLPDELVSMATGFGSGSASGCLCGAVVGATMGMGLVVGDDRKRLAALTRELHKWFAATYGAVCCRTIVAEQKGICATLTGRVAGKAAELLL
jgi:C_GCAxxG_C_C family probable redox protein